MITSAPSAAEVLSLSGALCVTQADEDIEEVTTLACEAFDGALEELLAMRAAKAGIWRRIFFKIWMIFRNFGSAFRRAHRRFRRNTASAC